MRRTTGAVVCPNCERLVAASEPRCPYCGAWRPGMFGYGPALQKLLGGQLDLNNLITGFCAVVFVVSFFTPPMGSLVGGGLLNLIAPSDWALLRLGMTGREILLAGHWWTVCTAIFLHGSALHILFNMVIMRRYLAMVVDLFGMARGFIIFMAAGIVGFLFSSLMNDHPSIGASGAVFGLLGALISYGRRTGQSYVTGQLWTTAIVMFVFSFMMGGNVNNWAHAGGFGGGFLAASLMPTTHRREAVGELVLAGGLALATLAGFVLSFVSFR